jgi:hypothetical protein
MSGYAVLWIGLNVTRSKLTFKNPVIQNPLGKESEVARPIKIKTARFHCKIGITGAQTGGKLHTLSGVFAPNSKHRILVTPVSR